MITLNDVFHIILINRKKIIPVTILGTIFFFIFLYLVYPLTYSSGVSILPPEAKQSSGLSSLLQGADFSTLLSASGTNANSQLYAEILKSRTAAEIVVKKLNLYAFLKKDDLHEAASKLSLMVSLEVTKEGIIRMAVPVDTKFFGRFSGDADETKVLSSKLTMAFVDALDSINRDKLSSKAKKARVYLEDQIVITKAKLDSVEKELMLFQKENKAISIPEQVKASLDAAIKLKSEIISSEISMGLLSQNLTENNSTLIALKSKLEELKNQYKKVESGDKDFLLAFKETPELGFKLTSLYRDVRILNELYLMLQQQYYKELIQEKKDYSTIEVLDPAIIPNKEVAPRIVFSSALAAILIFLIMSLISIVKEQKVFNFKKS